MRGSANEYNHFELTALRYKGTVIKHVFPKVLFFTLYTTLLLCLSEVVNINVDLPNSLVLVINSSISLLLVFRTNTAYDRYWEGRKIWGTMTTAIRNLVRLILVNVPNNNDEQPLEKKSAIDLLIAYPIATKHYLREEYGPDYDDLRDKLRCLPDYSFPSAFSSSGNQARQSLNLERGTNLPLDIKMYISSFIKHQQDLGNLTVPVATQLLSNLTLLVDCLNGFERILRTPIPLAYSIHLSQIVWAYCLFLPFQLIGPPGAAIEKGLRWVAIPAVAVVVFTFFGVTNIGEEIENPFGYDHNDLPLDNFCKILEEEISSLSKYKPPSVASWILPVDSTPPAQ